MLDSLGRHLVLVLCLIYRLCANCNFSFLHEILNSLLHYVLWAISSWSTGILSEKCLNKIAAEVRVLFLFIFYMLVPCSQMGALMHTYSLLINVLHIVYNQAAAKNQFFFVCVKEMKCISGANVWGISRNVRNSSLVKTHTHTHTY